MVGVYAYHILWDRRVIIYGTDHLPLKGYGMHTKLHLRELGKTRGVSACAPPPPRFALSN